jgi:polysaccharide pyruvyl transferase WcaK-like protein
LSAELGSGSPKIETRVLTTDAAIIAHQIGDLTVICGMRFHALVLAAMLGRPFLGLAHDNKISEICRTFAMPCYSVEELAGEKLVAATAAIKDRIPDSLLVQRARHLAQENFRAFAALTS